MEEQKDIQKREYEIGYLAKEEDNRQEIMKLLSSYQAIILNEGKAVKINLSYPIKKEKSAHFGFVWFSLEPELIKELTEKLKLNGKILRFLIITPPVQLRDRKIAARSREIIKPPKVKKQPALEGEQARPQKEETPAVIDNELLEKKLEEILK